MSYSLTTCDVSADLNEIDIFSVNSPFNLFQPQREKKEINVPIAIAGA